MRELLRWLDIIPGRRWLVLGPEAEDLAHAIWEDMQPAGVSVADDTQPFADSTFDVTILAQGEPSAAVALELRRVIWPAGTVCIYGGGDVLALSRMFEDASLHAIQTRVFGELTAVRGVR